MQENLPRRRYYAQDYGQRSTETQKNTVSNVMSFKGKTNPIEGMRCHYDHK
jgi:hypothetical protein